MNHSDILLLGPGPCNLSPRVREALARPMLGHLDPAFLEIMEAVKAQLRSVMGTRNAVTFPVSGTGSAGMEFLWVNAIRPGDRVVIGVNGVFGGRMAHLADRLGAEVHRVEAPWGERIPTEALLRAIDAHRPHLLGLVNGETSTGVYQPIEGLADAVHAAGGMLAVDCVTSLAGMPVNLDDWGVDLAFSGTQKCLACPPGLSPVTLSPLAVETLRARDRKVPSFYFDLEQILSYIDGEGGRSYHHTAPVSMVFALHAALAEVLEEGLTARFERHRQASEFLIGRMGELGFTPLVLEGDQLAPLTTLRLPVGMDEANVRRRLLTEHHIEVGGGLGPLAGKIWRVGLMGNNAVEASVERLADALSRVL